MNAEQAAQSDESIFERFFTCCPPLRRARLRKLALQALLVWLFRMFATNEGRILVGFVHKICPQCH